MKVFIVRSASLEWGSAPILGVYTSRAQAEYIVRKLELRDERVRWSSDYGYCIDECETGKLPDWELPS